MLKRFQVEKLYNLYNYDIALGLKGETPRFITGPNGYGKSTILNMISMIYHVDFNGLRNIPFLKIIADFETNSIEGVLEKRLQITRSVDNLSQACLHIDFIDVKSNIIGSSFTFPGPIQLGLELFFNENEFYYIRDQRLTKKQRIGSDVLEIKTIQEDVTQFKEKLETLSKNLTQDLLVTDLQFSDTISQDDYLTKIKEIDYQLEFAYKYGLLSRRQYPEYNNANALFLNAYVNVLQNAIAKYEKDFACLNAFREIINSYSFADKRFEINIHDGFRFVSTNELRTPLENETLSSGERQILIQIYELLFCAEQDAFVLVDEPEISSHYAWQLLYLENMNCIVKLKNLQCLVATHSPMIFNSEYELTIDLFEQHEQNLQIR